MDVTDRTLADAALLKSEEQLRLATDAAEVGFWDLDVVNGTLYWPAVVRKMFDVSPQAPITMNDFYEGLHPEDREQTITAFAAALDPAQRALYDVEYRTIGQRDRVVRWVAAKGRAVFDGDRCVRVIGTAIDITARKAGERKLQDLNERLEQRVAEGLAERKVLVDIVESTDALVQVLDPAFTIVAINRAAIEAWQRIYGLQINVGKNLLKLLENRPEHQAEQRKYWSRALAGEEFTAIDEFGDPTFERRHFEMKFNSLRDADSVHVGAYQFATDVTDRLRDQARLAEAEAHMRQAQKIEALGQLTGGVAHDFNNLLMVIKGGVSLLRRPGDPDRRERILSGMEQAADRGAGLTRQLLAFARRQPLKPEPVDLSRRISGMRELLDRTLRGDVQVTTRFPPDLWPVKVDPAELEFVVLNLCVNARDAMPNGGVITIELKNLPDIEEALLTGDFVSLSVADTGTGMPADVLAHVFEPFFTTKAIGKGSGLGLPQVIGFAQQSGGTVKIDTALGRGTRVTVLLPRSDAQPTPTVVSSDDLDNTARRRRLMGSILLVEDNDEVAALVTDMLQELGYHVTRSSNAQAALGALADDRPIDLVFSDVMMPGSMNGVGLAQEIKRRRPDVPVLLTTGYASDAANISQMAFVAVLHKPYNIEALDLAIRDTLKKIQQKQNFIPVT